MPEVGLEPTWDWKYLGHSTITLTQRYAHFSPGYLREGAQFFGPPAHNPQTIPGDKDAAPDAKSKSGASR